MPAHAPHPKRGRTPLADKFMDALTRLAGPDGGAVTAETLAETLDWDEQRTERVRQEMLKAERIVERPDGSIAPRERLAPAREAPLSVVLPATKADAALRDRLLAHLRPLERAGLVDLAAGPDMADADLVLPVVSIDFLNAADPEDEALQAALERHRQRLARLLPIIARPCLWELSPYAGLAALPQGARAITLWANEEEAFADVAAGIRAAAERMRRPAP